MKSFTKKFNVAVLGATGLVGQEMIKILEEKKIPVGELRPLASKSSAGKTIIFNNSKITVQKANAASFKNIDLALFSAGTKASLKFAPIAVESGCVVIDNSNAFRMLPHVPLIIPEVNPEDIRNHKGIIANPNCSTIQMLVALHPIHKKFGLDKIIVSTYQSVSGSGKNAVDELLQQTRQKLAGKPITKQVYPHQIAFNIVPQIDAFGPNGYTKEEMKMVNETHKIFADDKIRISATAVRVPVIYGHSESINFQTKLPAKIEEIISLLKEQKGLKFIDDPSSDLYPLAIDSESIDEVMVGRLRKDLSHNEKSFPNRGFIMWVVANNLRKGAALNAVQIAEILKDSL